MKIYRHLGIVTLLLKNKTLTAAFLANHFLVDLSSHYKKTISNQIKLIESIIEYSKIVKFLYSNQNIKQISVQPF